MSDPQSKSEHILSLAHDLLDDIELARLPAEQLVLKVSRLARLAGSEEVKQWLKYELQGYSGSGEVCHKYMSLTGRLTNKQKNNGYWQSLAGIESDIEGRKLQLQAMRIPDISHSVASANPHDLVSFRQPQLVINSIISSCSNINSVLGNVSQVKSKAISLMHSFVSELYYERIFSEGADSVRAA